jgi:hypothetical protein
MIKIVTAAAMFLALPIGAIAAPFCLVIQGATPECIYTDGVTCSNEASRQNGACDVNPAEVTRPTTRVGDYCVVLPAGASRCGYADGNECSRDALIQKGACVQGADSRTTRIPDAYAPIAGR